MSIRVFFSVPLKPSIARQLADHADSLSVHDLGGEVLWVAEENYHLTLCFIGEIPLEWVEALEAIARRVAPRHHSFHLHLGKTCRLSVNPELDVVAVCCQPSPELAELRADLAAELAAAGFPVSDGASMPHVTLGRMSPAAGYQPQGRDLSVDLSLCADAIELLQSRPGPQGSAYSPLFDVELLPASAGHSQTH